MELKPVKTTDIKPIRRVDMLNDIISRTGADTLQHQKLITNKDLVVRIWNAGKFFWIICERARKLVGYRMFHRKQRMPAKAFADAFLTTGMIPEMKGGAK